MPGPDTAGDAAPDAAENLTPVPQVAGPSPAALYDYYRVSPAFDPGTLTLPQTLYWEVVAQVKDATDSVVSESPAQGLSAFYYSIPTDITEGLFGGPGGASARDQRQSDPLIPAQKPRILRISPSPGFVHQDYSPE